MEAERKLAQDLAGDVGVGAACDLCLIPCDHVPYRSWPLFRARELMREVIETFRREQSR